MSKYLQESRVIHSRNKQAKKRTPSRYRVTIKGLAEPRKFWYHLYVVKATTATAPTGQENSHMCNVIMIVPVSKTITSTKLNTRIRLPDIRLHPTIDGNGGGTAFAMCQTAVLCKYIKCEIPFCVCKNIYVNTELEIMTTCRSTG